MKLAGMLMILSSIIFLFPFLAAAKPMTITPMKENGEVILFDSDTHDLNTINNYTAGWKKGSDIVPVAKEVTKGGEKYVEFSFSGNKGMACSTIYFSEIPDPDESMMYTGIVLVMDYDGDDYAKVSVNSSFSDKTSLTRALTLDKGTEEYPVKSGFSTQMGASELYHDKCPRRKLLRRQRSGK
jgi:hypothetical protein